MSTTTTPTVTADLTAVVKPGEPGATPQERVPYGVIEHQFGTVTVYLHQSCDDGPVLVVDVDSRDEHGDFPPIRVYLNDGPLYRNEK